MEVSDILIKLGQPSATKKFWLIKVDQTLSLRISPLGIIVIGPDLLVSRVQYGFFNMAGSFPHLPGVPGG